MKTTSILFLVSLYFLTPLHQPLSTVLHKVSHAISSTDSDHSHNNSSLKNINVKHSHHDKISSQPHQHNHTNNHNTDHHKSIVEHHSHNTAKNHKANHHKSHGHKLISIFKDFFSETSQNENHQLTKIEFDKHFFEIAVYKPEFHKKQTAKNYFWLVKNYTLSLPNSSPPPQITFS